MAAIAARRSSLCTMPAPVSQTLPPQAAEATPSASAQQKHTFALAQVKGDICLVQVPHTSAQGGMASALMATDVDVFRHEFIKMFRYSHRATVHPTDIVILESIEDDCTLYEEDKGTVFLAPDVMTRYQMLTREARRQSLPHRYRHHSSQWSAFVLPSRMRL